MQTNEKAPDAMAGNQSAIKTKQIKNSIEPESCQQNSIIAELVQLAKRMGELNNDFGIINIGSCGNTSVLIDDEFFDLFDFGEYDDDYTENYSKYFTSIDGVEFSCLVKKIISNDLE